MANKLMNKSVILGVTLSMILTGFVVMGTGNVGALPATPTIYPVIPDILMSQGSVYNYDLSHHESDDNDVPVPPLVSILDDTGLVYYIQCDGIGGFSSMIYLGDIGHQSRGTVVGDFDNDGDYDIIAGASDGNWYGWVYYYENIGTPTTASFGASVYV